jgi:uncharacterized protein YlxW (UPF0749 family)
MTRIIFELSELDYLSFAQKVGKGNMSEHLRNYIKTVVGSKDRNTNEMSLRKSLLKAEEQSKEINTEITRINRKLKAMEAKKEAKEKAAEEELRKQKEHAKSIERATVQTHSEEMIFRGKK